MNAQDVADYLQQHPEFFDEHAGLFSTLTVPHPHGGRAIPLAERQMMTLREKNRGLELKVAELLRFGQENDAIAERLARWTRMLLLQRSMRLLPETLTGSLEEIFSVPQVALSLWDATDEFAEVARARDASTELIEYVATLTAPYCGMPMLEAAHVLPLFHGHASAHPNEHAPALAVAHMAAHDGEPLDAIASGDAPQDWPQDTKQDAKEGAKQDTKRDAADVRSVALIPLRRGAAPAAFGVLALGSADPRRFHDGMGTDFLARIGETSSAALTRLLR